MGVVGLFLMLVVAKLTEPAYFAGPGAAARITSFAARRVIDGIAVVGWLFDHVPGESDAVASHGFRLHLRGFRL